MCGCLSGGGGSPPPTSSQRPCKKAWIYLMRVTDLPHLTPLVGCHQLHGILTAWSLHLDGCLLKVECLQNVLRPRQDEERFCWWTVSDPTLGRYRARFRRSMKSVWLNLVHCLTRLSRSRSRFQSSQFFLL